MSCNAQQHIWIGFGVMCMLLVLRHPLTSFKNIASSLCTALSERWHKETNMLVFCRLWTRHCLLLRIKYQEGGDPSDDLCWIMFFIFILFHYVNDEFCCIMMNWWNLNNFSFRMNEWLYDDLCHFMNECMNDSINVQMYEWMHEWMKVWSSSKKNTKSSFYNCVGFSL